MQIETVAILSPGDMGHAVGRALREHGLSVISHLEGRSERTRELAGLAGIADVASLEELVRQGGRGALDTCTVRGVRGCGVCRRSD